MCLLYVGTNNSHSKSNNHQIIYFFHKKYLHPKGTSKNSKFIIFEILSVPNVCQYCKAGKWDFHIIYDIFLNIKYLRTIDTHIHQFFKKKYVNFRFYVENPDVSNFLHFFSWFFRWYGLICKTYHPLKTWVTKLKAWEIWFTNSINLETRILKNTKKKTKYLHTSGTNMVNFQNL